MKIPHDMISGMVYSSVNYGDLKIVEYFNCTKVLVRFLDTDHEKMSTSAAIRRGKVKDPFKPYIYDVGYIGVGSGITYTNGKMSKSYTVWSGMLQRCYSKNCRPSYPTYKDCTVCDEWHNFQVFDAWFKLNYIEGYDLDKDIKVKGNKIYSPSTCIFVSKKENAIEAKAKHYTFTSPDGEIVEVYNLTEFCRDNDLHAGHMCNVNKGNRRSHKGWTREHQST